MPEETRTRESETVIPVSDGFAEVAFIGNPNLRVTVCPEIVSTFRGFAGASTKGRSGGVTRTLSARYHKDGSEILVAGEPRPRRLTPVECARLMGFEHGDRRWKIPVSDTQAYRQFGNAVVPPLIEAIARYMEPSLLEMLARDHARSDARRVAVG